MRRPFFFLLISMVAQAATDLDFAPKPQYSQDGQSQYNGQCQGKRQE